MLYTIAIIEISRRDICGDYEVHVAISDFFRDFTRNILFERFFLKIVTL